LKPGRWPPGRPALPALSPPTAWISQLSLLPSRRRLQAWAGRGWSLPLPPAARSIPPLPPDRLDWVAFLFASDISAVFAAWRFRGDAVTRRCPEQPLDTARALLDSAVSLADNAENVPLWWMTNLCRHLIDDLWQHSLHQNLPTQPPEGSETQYSDLRRLFISSLYARKASEVELWPSQRDAVRRSTGPNRPLLHA
jgi:hypothetical protein